MTRMETHLSPFWTRLAALAGRVNGLPYFVALQRGLAPCLPLILIGAVMLVLRVPPAGIGEQTLTRIFGTSLNAFCDTVIAATFGIAALGAVLGFSVELTTLHNQRHPSAAVGTTTTSMTVVSCFFLTVAPRDDRALLDSLSLDSGLLTALFVASIGGALFLRLCRFRFLRFPAHMCPNSSIGNIFSILPAATATILTFALVERLLDWHGVPAFDQIERHYLGGPVFGLLNDLSFGISYQILAQVLWFFGAHGPNLLHGLEEHVLFVASTANNMAVMLKAEPHFILTSQFFDVFVRMGGSGSTLCLIFALLLDRESQGKRGFALLCLIPAVFNVNEPLLFGLPIVFNPLYAIPFILAPVVQTVIAYGAMALEWVPVTSYRANWTTPIFLNGFLATGSLRGPVLQVVELLAGFVIYLPFVRLAAIASQRRTREILGSLLHIAETHDSELVPKRYLTLDGEEGWMVSSLSQSLKKALAVTGQIFLEYQPQYDARERRTTGAEALLRWRHPQYGRVAPPVVVTMAEDLGLIEQLGFLVLTEACRQRAAWLDRIPDSFTISVNVSPTQLADPGFDAKVLATLAREGVDPAMMEIEITETSIAPKESHVIEGLKRLQAAGMKVALDDFGMGHTSLHYLREMPLDIVKLDRSLTEACQTNVNEHIIRGLVEMSRTMNISTIVEGVEDQGQFQRLRHLGCERFQGYYISRPLSADACLSFVLSEDHREEWASA